MKFLSKINWWPFKKRKGPSLRVVSRVKITHKSGEIITIIVEGNTSKYVSFISNKIKNNFGINQDIWEEADKKWPELEKEWNKLDKVFNNVK